MQLSFNPIPGGGSGKITLVHISPTIHDRATKLGTIVYQKVTKQYLVKKNQ